MKTTTEMQLVPVTKLVPYVNNARTHSPEQINKLRSSLREFGFINPVIIDRDYGVIAGHGRILAAKEEGISEVPCVFADHLTEAQKKAYIIADNRMWLLHLSPTATNFMRTMRPALRRRRHGSPCFPRATILSGKSSFQRRCYPQILQLPTAGTSVMRTIPAIIITSLMW